MSFVLLGQHRSGTSFVNSLVREHPLVESINEPFSQHLHLFREREFEEWGSEFYTDRQLHPAIRPGGDCEAYVLGLRDWMHATLPGQRGFKETGLIEKGEWLRAVFGDVPTVVLVRDPRAVVASVLRRGMQNSWWSYRSRLEELIERGVDVACDLTNPVAVVATVWKRRTERCLALAAQYQWLTLRLEDLMADPKGRVLTLMNHLELDPHQRQFDFLSEAWSETLDGTYSYRREAETVLNQWREVLNSDDQHIVESTAGDLLADLGYTSDLRFTAAR